MRCRPSASASHNTKEKHVPRLKQCDPTVAYNSWERINTLQGRRPMITSDGGRMRGEGEVQNQYMVPISCKCD